MRTLLTAALAAALLAPALATAEADTDPATAAAHRGLQWLASQQNLDGSIGEAPAVSSSAYAALAFARAGIDPGTVALPGGKSLEAFVVASTRPTADTNVLARQVLALAASGAALDAPGFDVLAALRATFDGTQFGDRNLVNDDLFAIQALLAAGVPASDPQVQAARSFLLAHQQPSGAFSFGALHPTNPDVAFALTFADVDTTGQALVALLRSGSAPDDAPIVRALAWIKGNQNLDGGCTWSPLNLAFAAAFDPAHLGQSNTDSTTWALMGLRAAGQDVGGARWASPTGTTLVDYVLDLQQGDGSFLYQPGAAGALQDQTTAYAVVALLGHDFVA